MRARKEFAAAVVGGLLLAGMLGASSVRAYADEPFEVGLPPPGPGMRLMLTAPGPLPPPFPGPMMGDGPAAVMPLLVAATLTDEQRAQVHEIMTSRRTTLDGLFDKLRTLNDQLAAKLLAPGALGDQDLASLVEQIAAARTELVEDGVKVALAVRNVLTPEQLAKAADTHKRLEALEAERRELLGDRVLFLTN